MGRIDLSDYLDHEKIKKGAYDEVWDRVFGKKNDEDGSRMATPEELAELEEMRKRVE